MFQHTWFFVTWELRTCVNKCKMVTKLPTWSFIGGRMSSGGSKFTNICRCVWLLVLNPRRGLHSRERFFWYPNKTGGTSNWKVPSTWHIHMETCYWPAMQVNFVTVFLRMTVENGRVNFPNHLFSILWWSVVCRCLSSSKMSTITSSNKLKWMLLVIICSLELDTSPSANLHSK